MATDVHAVAIVGLGPKGLHCLERLIAWYHAAGPLRPLRIHVFNREGQFGTSPVYDLSQPEYILLNVPVGEVDLWAAADPPAYAGRGPNYVQWHRETFAQALEGGEFLSRAMVGHYLCASFKRLAQQLPPHLELVCHDGEVMDLSPEGQGYRLDGANGAGEPFSVCVDHVLLATGHAQLLPTREERHYLEYCRDRADRGFIPFVYPVTEKMAPIPSGTRVAIKGLGLTFIDAVLALTEGRGGSFARDEGGKLIYRASGREPAVIYPFSRTGLPMAPKAFDLPDHLRPLTFFTPEALQRLSSEQEGPLELEGPLWQLFELEMYRYYYQWAMGDGPFRQRLEACGDDAAALRDLIASFHAAVPQAARFDYRQALDPAASRCFAGGGAFTAFVLDYMTEEIERAKLGLAGCGIKSALDIWYEARYVLSGAMQFGGLTPASHRQLMETYNPPLKRLVFGPPLINIEKLKALLIAGILDFSVARMAQVHFDQDLGCFQLTSPVLPGAPVRVSFLVDGRFPETHLTHLASPLYQNMQRRGLVRPLVNRDGDAEYVPGSIDYTREGQYIIDADGHINPRIAVIGIPTEGNVLGNFTIVASPFSGVWARNLVGALKAQAAE